MESEGNKFRTHSGVHGGEIVVSEWTVCESKNIGKKNETTEEEQCLLEVAANYKKKLAQGNYKESLDEETLNQDNFIKPMLAKEYGEDYEYIEGTTVFSQAKFDGLRCIVTSKGLFSRQGKPVISAPHILKELEPIFKEYPNLVLDGELYSDRLSDNFNEIISLARKSKPEPEDLLKSKDYIQYWIKYS
jgi:ATP-dependent DNA ligase